MRRLIMRLRLVWFIVFLAGFARASDFLVKQPGEIKSKQLKEISGMAFSGQNGSCLWVINDSGSKPEVHALTWQGKRIGSLFVNGVKNRDWEDLALFELDEYPFLAIGEIGDNRSVYPFYQIIFIAEPHLSVFDNSEKSAVTPYHILTFMYEDGPRDCESMAVDEKNQTIYLLSKRTIPPVLYQLPLDLTTDSLIVARRVTTVTTIPKPTLEDLGEDPKQGRYCAQPTSMDINQNQLVVLTYKRVFIYEKENSRNCGEALNQLPLVFQFPHLKQAESVCISPVDGSIWITSEGKKAPILQIYKP